MNPSFLGKGFAFPLQVTRRGGIEQASEAEKVREAILVLLGTQYGERLMRPTFGCNLKSLVFAPNNLATANLAKHYVTEGLQSGEPRALLDDVVVVNDNREGRLVLNIRYRLRSTHEPQNLVYPFYLQQPQA
jgi:phage baseplate assembly protein W